MVGVDKGTMLNGGEEATSVLSKCLPGRLGEPSKSILEDKRLDPRIRVKYAEQASGGDPDAAPTLEVPDSYEDCLPLIAEMEKQWKGAYEMMSTDMEKFKDISVETTTVDGVDGNLIEIEIRRPVAANKPLPCILRIHGGGMAILSSRLKGFTIVELHLAQMGSIVVNVEFRNSGGELGNHPFPAGLDDCVSVIEWIASNKEKLGYSSFIVMGESGGGNLAIASVMKYAKQKKGSPLAVDGVFAACPFISNAYHAKWQSNLLSLIENDNYLIDCKMLSIIAKAYTTKPEDSVNPLAWPLHATADDLRGLPPFFISVNELDPLRDEGKAFYIKLVEAGVSATCQIVCGTEHGGDIIAWNECPEIFNATMRNIISFAKSFEKDQ